MLMSSNFVTGTWSKPELEYLQGSEGIVLFKISTQMKNKTIEDLLRVVVKTWIFISHKKLHFLGGETSGPILCSSWTHSCHDLLGKILDFLLSIKSLNSNTCHSLTGMVGGSFLPTATWPGEVPAVIWGGFTGVRLPCGRNVEKKFLDGVVPVLTARWLDTKSLRGQRQQRVRKLNNTEWEQLDPTY